MNNLDWYIIIIYIAGLLIMSYHLGKQQGDEKDYYIGGKKVHWFPVSISTMATQLSTNSLLGAPAFVAFSIGGGLLWLQYELAVPLAMVFIMVFLVPFFKKSGVISIYEYLNLRFGPATSVMLSILFQFIVAFGTGVTVYGISLVLQTVIGVPFWVAVLLLGVVTIIYDTLGGIKGVIASDVIQMFILVSGIFIIGYFAVSLTGGVASVLEHFDPNRLKALDFSGHGLGDASTFSFLPMLIGGFFLYVAYYGCNQTQVQRILATKNLDDANKALFLNGLLRFPVVMLYCFMGVTIGAFANLNPGYIDLLPKKKAFVDGVVQMVPNYNTAVPTFVLEYLPHGIIGIIIIALFAAAMSSLDSTLNSLSAVTMRDIVDRFYKRADQWKPKQKLLMSKSITVFWGIVILIFSFLVGDISDSIIVSINKIGSLANGSILGTFLLAIFTKRATDKGTVIGIIAGFLVNLYLWSYVPSISWMWWNVIGCVVTCMVGYSVSFLFKPHSEAQLKNLIWRKGIRESYFQYEKNWNVYYVVLLGYFSLIIFLLFWIS